MKTSEWITLSQAGTAITEAQADEISQMVARNPWFSYGQMLHLKALKQQQNPSFEQQLAVASLYAMSRKKLCAFLQAEPIAQAVEPSVDAGCSALPSAKSMLTRDIFELLPPDTICEVDVATADK
ncbi:MAG: hypothetical protein LBS94_00080 [Prevotellaceae bacterium]|jgi:hypothetical protein|nr:hypothetical protein [Prevotellaceae bacterium]